MQEDVNNEKESLEPRDIGPVAKKTWSETAAAAGVLTMVEVDGKVIDDEEVLGDDATKKRTPKQHRCLYHSRVSLLLGCSWCCSFE